MALWLISHSYAPEVICELFDISPRIVSTGKWQQNDVIYGSVIPPSQYDTQLVHTNLLDLQYNVT